MEKRFDFKPKSPPKSQQGEQKTFWPQLHTDIGSQTKTERGTRMKKNQVNRPKVTVKG
jgi:hypothetical protein